MIWKLLIIVLIVAAIVYFLNRGGLGGGRSR